MICVETQYFNLNKIFLLAIGLWPYQKLKFRRLQTTLCFGILTSFVIFQFTTLITTKCTADFIIKIFSSTTFFSIYIIQYNMFWINIHHVKSSLQQLQCFYNELKDENELAIFKKYGHYTRQCTIILISIAIYWTFIATLLPIWPQIIRTVLYINKSQLQSQTIQIVTEYFVDQEKYYYLILLHTNTVFCIGATTFTATGTMLLGYMIHACGLFAITRFCEFLCSTFKGSFFLMLIFMVTSLSLNILGIFRNASLETNEAFLLHLLFASAILFYTFVVNYIGQEITNHNNHVYFTVYNSRWYNASLHAQKLILFVLLRGSKACNLNIGGLIVASLECFASLTKSSVSYFTVMYSMEE